jgi:HAD superfamily hydrolase (TIGR01509 family)
MPEQGSAGAGAGRALIFDFDGLILDTDWAEYLSWQKVFAGQGQALEIRDFMHAVGAPRVMDFRLLLETRLGRSLEWATLEEERLRHRAGIFAGQKVLPGVRELMVEGAARGWRVGVASSSPRSWVFGHLRSHGLDAWVETMRTSDNVPAMKPAPDAYLLACRDLDSDPARSLAFEDSATGVGAARAAGLHVVAVPNRITVHHDLGAAHQVVKSLQGFKLPA